MIAFALVLQLQAASMATGDLKLVPPQFLMAPVSLAESNLRLAPRLGPEGEQTGVRRGGGVRAGQILAGTGLHLLVSGVAMGLGVLSLACGLSGDGSGDAGGCSSAALLGIGGAVIYVFGAPAMAALGAKWAADGDAQIGPATYLWAVLVNLAAAGVGIAIITAIRGATGLIIGLAAGAVGASTVAALTLEYPAPSDPGGQAGLPRLAELARPMSAPTSAAPTARFGAASPLLAFRW
jgi:hypothetical protein